MTKSNTKIIVVPATEIRGADGHFPNFEKDKKFDRHIYVGGEVRMQAAIEAAKKYPEAEFIMLGGWALKDGELLSKPEDMAGFLKENAPEVKVGIINSLPSTRSNLVALFNTLGEEIKEGRLIFLTNDYHIDRIQAIWSKLKTEEYPDMADPEILTVSDLGVKEGVEQAAPEYQLRLEREQEGIEALKRGEYTEQKRISIEQVLQKYPKSESIILTPKERQLWRYGFEQRNELRRK